MKTTINSIIDKHQLAYYFVLKNFGEEGADPQWKELEKQLQAKYEATAGYLFFQPKYIGWGLRWVGYADGSMNLLGRDSEAIHAIFEDIFASEVFRQCLLETQEYKTHVMQVWDTYGHEAVQYVENITGMHMPESITVAVLHPSLEIGSYMRDNLIEWGMPNIYEKSEVVGLVHECMHQATEELAGQLMSEENRWILHALIHLTTDQQLRMHIRPGDTYFQPEYFKEYQKQLISIAQSLLPQWKEYMNQETKSLEALFEQVKV